MATGNRAMMFCAPVAIKMRPPHYGWELIEWAERFSQPILFHSEQLVVLIWQHVPVAVHSSLTTVNSAKTMPKKIAPSVMCMWGKLGHLPRNEQK